MTQAATVAELKARQAFDWPALWGIVWSHREACMVEALPALDTALADPKLTRQELRPRMVEARVAGRGRD